MNRHLHFQQFQRNVLLFGEQRKLARVDKKLTTQSKMVQVFLNIPPEGGIFFSMGESR